MRNILYYFLFSTCLPVMAQTSWIRLNLLGYTPSQTKVAVYCSKQPLTDSVFVVEDTLGRVYFTGIGSQDFGEYGPFHHTRRLDFSSLTQEGTYIIRSGGIISPRFSIKEDLYDGGADFCLRYMRQQRCGFNPCTRDSCHHKGVYTLYGPMPDSTYLDISGGWHDASDYLQYVATSANAVYHLLAAYRDFPGQFDDTCLSSGLSGRNSIPDVVDEAIWGLDWLVKMHPRPDWMFHQLADDRDHISMRMPGLDNQYGRGWQRPVYYSSGTPHGSEKHKNRSTGLASVAGKMALAFALGSQLVIPADTSDTYYSMLAEKALSAFRLGRQYPGVCQTAPHRAPYFYEEDNWSDDMQLAAVLVHRMDSTYVTTIEEETNLLAYSSQMSDNEKVTKWMIEDTARHYQGYPFINAGHYELAKEGQSHRKKCMDYYREGMDRVMARARENAFNRGIPFIWCSNNLTVSFAIQSYWYRKMTGDTTFRYLEQACVDWLLGCNPWGTSFIYGFSAGVDTPVDPHSAFTHIGKYSLDGALVDGPVKGSIYNRLIGIRLYEPDEYAAFQSDFAVYHDDYGDYSTNEPTMDGVASLIYLMAALRWVQVSNSIPDASQ